jgi:hypothetical protein
MASLTELFCLIDDFCQRLEPAGEKRLLTDGQKKRRRPASLSLSELVTLAVLFHQLRYRQFKRFSLSYALRFLRIELPGLTNDHYCLKLMPRCAVAFSGLFEHLKGRCTGITILDSSTLIVCDNLRISGIACLSGSLHAARVRPAGSMAWNSM